MRISRSFNEDCHASLVRFCPVIDGAGSLSSNNAPHLNKVTAVMCLSRKLLEQRLLLYGDKEQQGAQTTPEMIPEACARHLQFELLARSESLVLDPLLAEACDEDRERFCPNVPEGFGEVGNQSDLDPGGWGVVATLARQICPSVTKSCRKNNNADRL